MYIPACCKCPVFYVHPKIATISWDMSITMGKHKAGTFSSHGVNMALLIIQCLVMLPYPRNVYYCQMMRTVSAAQMKLNQYRDILHSVCHFKLKWSKQFNAIRYNYIIPGNITASFCCIKYRYMTIPIGLRKHILRSIIIITETFVKCTVWAVTTERSCQQFLCGQHW